jgi:hypothetical protein
MHVEKRLLSPISTSCQLSTTLPIADRNSISVVGFGMSKTPKKDEIKDEPGADDRFLRRITKALNTPPKPFTKPKAKEKVGKGGK